MKPPDDKGRDERRGTEAEGSKDIWLGRTPALPQSCGHVSLILQRAQAERVMALGQTSACGVGHQGAMVKGGRRQTKRAIEENLAGGGEKQIGTANDFGDSHSSIVCHHGQLVGGRVILTPDDKITEILSGDELLKAEITIHK